MSMTDAEIREALARAERATPGPWRWHSVDLPGIGYGPFDVAWLLTNGRVREDGYSDGACIVRHNAATWVPKPADRDFLAHARTDVPRLAADLLAARAERDEARQRAERFLQEINRLGQCAEDARDGERREYARAEAAETELAELRRWKDTHSVGSTLRTRAETAERERDEARAFLRDFLHTTSGKKSLDGAPLSRLESAAQRLLSPSPPHTCQIHRATSGASDCGLEPCEEATVHTDRGASRPAETSTPEAAKCATCGGIERVAETIPGAGMQPIVRCCRICCAHHGPDCHGCGGAK